MISCVDLETPLGTMIACATEKGLCYLGFKDTSDLQSQLDALTLELGSATVNGADAYLQTLQHELNAYFEGNRTEFTIPLHTLGTPFQREVWASLRNIPYGTTRSYKQQSIELKNPKAIRAVANANGKNHIAILIPCHRIIGWNGSLTGYAGGLWRKKWLLDLEMNSQLKLNF